MADPNLVSPFDETAANVNPNPSPEEFSKLKQQWDQFLADPKGVSALANFGIALMQPVGLGQSAFGQVGQALGHAGEAVRTVEKQDIAQQLADVKQQEAETRQTARERASQLREQGLGLQEMRFGFQKERDLEKLRIQQERTDLMRQRGEARTVAEQAAIDARLRVLDQADVRLGQGERRLGLQETDVRRTGVETERSSAALAARTASNIIGQIKEHERSQEFVHPSRKKPLPPDLAPYEGKSAAQIQEMLRAGTAAPAPPVSLGPRSAAPGPWVGSYSGPLAPGTNPPGAGPFLAAPSAPTNPADREVGATYMTPKGELRWTGEGWQAP